MLDDKTKAMVFEALDDEYKARALYRLVIKAFGPVPPFINIVEAPDNDTVARISVELGSRGTVTLTTLAAMPVEQFTQMLKGK